MEFKHNTYFTIRGFLMEPAPIELRSDEDWCVPFRYHHFIRPSSERRIEHCRKASTTS